tara:strand:- start:5067 stop:5897 length:831 start_codon:yes stop_codon:yes gene_type:complete
MTTYKDGIYDISNDEYHASNGISRSRLMLLDKSPYHFWYETLSGLAEKRESTPAMAIGSAFHTLLLEPEKFSNEYAVAPKIDRRTKQGKEDYETFMQETAGKILLSDDQFVKVNNMVELVNKHEIVTTLLDEAVFEQSIFWTDEETGLQFKTRPDIWSAKMVVDLKTTADASSYAFTRSAMNYGYYLQAGMAFEACKAIGKPFEMFVILACEKEAPHVPAVYMMDDEALQFGIAQFSNYKKKLKACLDADKWEGYPVQELGIPKYATQQLENENDQ